MNFYLSKSYLSYYSAIINYEDMRADGYDKSLDKECSGYVVVKSVSISFEYKAYIKCPNYTTKGYQEY